MPAKTRKQQRFFGLVRALQKGEVSARSVGEEVRRAARDVSPDEVREFTRLTKKKKR